jgi:hypothetical protein
MHLSHPGKSLGFHCSKRLALALATIHQQPLPLPHYCGISDLPTSTAQTAAWMDQLNKQLQQLVSCMLSGAELSY